MANISYKNLLTNLKAYLLILGLAALGQSYAAQAPKAPISDSKVKFFAYQTLMATYEYNYKNIINSQREAAKLFTGKGWVSFQKAIIDSKVLIAVKQNRYQVSATPLQPADIVKQGLADGRYYWDLKYPAMVVYKNASYQQVQYLEMDMRIVYQDKLLVEQLVAKKGKPINCQQNSSNIEVKE